MWTDHAVREALGVTSETADAPDLAFERVSTDTRKVKPGDLFVALQGEHFDGHDFIPEAVRRGARAAVVSRSVDTGPDIRLYMIADTLRGLGELARYRRRALTGQVVGVTGSSGKTTVKELLAAALGGSFEVYATEGNLNNRVGLPLCLLSAPVEAEYVVLELGTNEPGEIRTLTDIAQPDHALVTTVSEAHLSGLTSLEGVLSEKLDLIRGARPDGTAVVGDEPEVLAERARALRPDVHVAGLSERAEEGLRGELVGQDLDGGYRIALWGREVKAGIPGRHGARNLVLALATARLLGANEDAAMAAASAVEPGHLRGEVRRIGGLTMVLDCYNANPQSVFAALDLLAEFPGAARRVAVLGSMLELGDRSDDLHRMVLRRAASLPLDIVVATGDFAAAAEALASQGAADRPPLEVIVAETPDEGYEALRPRLRGTETVLLKGSRGVALETLLDRFIEDFGGEAGSAAAGDGRDPVWEA